MSRIGLQAVTAAAILVFGSLSARADADPAISPPFLDGTLQPVDDTELAGATGRGLTVESASVDHGSRSRLAVILWDESKPRGSQTNGLTGTGQAAGRIVITVGPGSVAGR